MANSAKVVSSRDILLYYQPWNSANDFPADTVEWGTSWGGNWVDAGYTQGGLQFSAEVTRGEIRMDQALDPVKRPATGRTVTMGGQLGEFDLDAVVTATGQGTVTALAATTAARGYDQWSMGSTVQDNFYSVGFDVLHDGDDEAIRFLGVYAQPVGAQQWTISPENALLTPFTLTLLPEPSTGRVALIRDLIPISA